MMLAATVVFTLMAAHAADYEAMAAAGDTKAMVTLGARQAQAGDHAGAMQWWSQAAAGGDAWGYLNPGVHFREGIGVAQDVVFACALSRKAQTVQTEDNRAAVERLLEKSTRLLTAEQRALCEAWDLEQLKPAEILEHEPGPHAALVVKTEWTTALAALPSRAEAREVAASPIASAEQVEVMASSSAVSPLDKKQRERVGDTAVRVGEYTVPAPALAGTGVRALLEGPARVVYQSHPSALAGWDPSQGYEMASFQRFDQAEFDGVEFAVQAPQRLQEVYPDQLDLRAIQTPWGPAMQLVILNSLPDVSFPLGLERMSGERDRIHHVSVLRLVAGSDGEPLVFGLVVAPEGSTASEQLTEATHRMDGWMTGVLSSRQGQAPE